LHGCDAYFWQGEPFIAVTEHQQLAYRVSEATDALPLPNHLEYWSPNGKALRRWRVLAHDGPRDWMPMVLRALELVQAELVAAASVTKESGRNV